MPRHKHKHEVQIVGTEAVQSTASMVARHEGQTSAVLSRAACQWCGGDHDALCPRVKSIEYHEGGIFVKRVEFWLPLPNQKQ